MAGGTAQGAVAVVSTNIQELLVYFSCSNNTLQV